MISAEIELADAPDSQVENAIDDPFRDFKNVDYELETPDGIEGPVPALVKAPQKNRWDFLIQILEKMKSQNMHIYTYDMLIMFWTYGQSWLLMSVYDILRVVIILILNFVRILIKI